MCGCTWLQRLVYSKHVAIVTSTGGEGLWNVYDVKKASDVNARGTNVEFRMNGSSGPSLWVEAIDPSLLVRPCPPFGPVIHLIGSRTH